MGRRRRDADCDFADFKRSDTVFQRKLSDTEALLDLLRHLSHLLLGHSGISVVFEVADLPPVVMVAHVTDKVHDCTVAISTDLLEQAVEIDRLALQLDHRPSHR